MAIGTLVYPRPFCTKCTLRRFSFADVYIYLGVPSSLMYPVYLETFVLCRCPSVPWCTLVPSATRCIHEGHSIMLGYMALPGVKGLKGQVQGWYSTKETYHLMKRIFTFLFHILIFRTAGSSKNVLKI